MAFQKQITHQTIQIRPADETVRHPMAHVKGGFHMSINGWDQTKECSGEIIKIISTKLLKGEFVNCVSFKKPVKLCSPITFLESCANENQYCSVFLQKAANSYALTQIKHILTFLIAGYHINPQLMGVKAPLEPRSGETYSAHKSDGTQIFVEAISTDPQQVITHIQGAQNKYTLIQRNISLMQTKNQFNTLIAYQKGYSTIKFHDGHEYKITYPEMVISGLIIGERIMNLSGTLHVESLDNGVTAEIKFDEQRGGVGQTLLGMFGKKEAKPLSDKFKISIEQDGEIVSKGSGSWLEGVEFDGQEFWNIHQSCEPWSSSQIKLPSDSTHRQDRLEILKNNIESASQYKRQHDDMDDKDIKNRNRKY